MSSSPFEIVRNNLKPLMVVLTLLAILSFVVLPVVDSYMRRQSGGGPNEVLASYDGVDLTRTRVEYFTRNHSAVLRFLNELAELTISRGGVPRIAGFDYDAQLKRVRSLGVNPSPSEIGTIRTLMLAEKARQAGFELDDGTLRRWVNQFTDGGTVPENEAIALLMQSTRNAMGRPHLYEQLRNHFLADVYLQRGSASLVSTRGELKTPDQQWQSFLKLNQNCKITAYGVLVDDFIEQTSQTPSEAEIRDMYEQGKDIDPTEQSPEHGFHRQYTAEFEYVVGDLQKFIDEEMGKLTEEQLRAEYQRRLKGGDFIIPASMSDGDDAESGDSGDDDGEPSAGEDSSPKEEPEEAAVDAPETDEPTEEPVADQADRKADQPDSAAEAVSPEAEIETDAPETTKADEVPAAESSSDGGDAPDPADQSRRDLCGAVRLVGLQNADDTAEETDAGETAETDSAADADEPKENGDTEPAEPAEASDGNKKPEEMKGSDDVSSPSSSSPEPSNSDAAAAPKTEANTNESAEATEDGDTGEANAAGEPAEPETTQSFEDVRDEIARSLAEPLARDRMAEMVAKAATVMNKYSRSLSIYESHVSGGVDDKEPTRPDLAKLASEIGFEHRSNVGPFNAIDISQDPIGDTYDSNGQFGRRGPSLGLMMYGYDTGQNVVPPRPLFSVLQTTDDPTNNGKTYVVWKTKQTQAYSPPLDEVRDEVILAIRTDQARELAKAKAHELADKANAGEKLADLINENQKANLYDSLGPFTWMNMAGSRRVSIGNIRDLDSVGPEFMKAAFSTAVGTYTVAPNEPQRAFYVISPIEFSPSLSELQERFRQPIMRMLSTAVPSGQFEIQRGFYELIDEEAGFEDFTETN